MVNAIARFKGQRVSKHEIESVAYFIDKFLLSSSLLNDLYSFVKEFDDHSTTGNVNTIANAMVLLMSIYGYTEDEAAGILKQEIQALETQALKDFNTWQDLDSAKSSNLVGYCFTIVNMIGGMNYWMSHSERYLRTNLKTTAEDRARLVGFPPGLRTLENYPPPLAMQDFTPIAPLRPMAQTKDSESNDASIFKRVASGQTPLDGSEFTDFATSITRSFRKAESDKVLYNMQMMLIITDHLNSYAWHHTTTSARSLARELLLDWLTRHAFGSMYRLNRLKRSRAPQ